MVALAPSAATGEPYNFSDPPAKAANFQPKSPENKPIRQRPQTRPLPSASGKDQSKLRTDTTSKDVGPHHLELGAPSL
jgi:hypothetical protein